MDKADHVDEVRSIHGSQISVPANEIHILRFWICHRRALLTLGLILVLALFLVLLPAAARTAILDGVLARRSLVGLLIFFSLLVLSLVWSAGQQLDAWVFMRFNLWGFHPVWADKIMWYLTQIGTFVAALALAAAFSWLGLRRLSIEVVLGTITLWLVVELIKALTDRSRPYVVLAGARVIGWRERGKSFPSGHTAQTFFLMSLLVHHFQPGLGGSLILYGLAVLVGITRMYVGAHYPRDVLAGALLGSMWSLWNILVDPFLMQRQL